ETRTGVGRDHKGEDAAALRRLCPTDRRGKGEDRTQQQLQSKAIDCSVRHRLRHHIEMTEPAGTVCSLMVDRHCQFLRSIAHLVGWAAFVIAGGPTAWNQCVASCPSIAFCSASAIAAR